MPAPWIEDNLWVLETIQPEPIMVGTVGNLQPDKPEFAEYLARYAKNPALSRHPLRQSVGLWTWSARWTIPPSSMA